MENNDSENEGLDALCRECGHAFKAYVDRILPEEKADRESRKPECPVCGCTDCSIGK
jgi:hypothetical protein